MSDTPVDLTQAFASFDEAWSPRLVAELNGQHVRVAKLRGAFTWHAHEEEDELFLVHRGELRIEREGPDGLLPPIDLGPGQLYVVPRGLRHRPVTRTDEVEVLLFEPASTINTGDAEDARRRDETPPV